MKSANSTKSGRVVSIWSGVSVIVLCGVLLLASGCQQDDPESAGTEVATDETVVISLETTFQGLRPDEFEFIVPRDRPTSDLNEWGNEMLADMLDPEVDEQELSKSLANLLPAEVVERTLRPQFVLRDSNHVRDSLWAREVADSITESSKSELDAVVDLFYFVTNTVHAVPAAESLPFGPFETVRYGFGTAEDRAWTFATLLRQRRIPAVVFVASQLVTEESDSSGRTQSSDTKNLLVGVLLNESIYLFDAGLGLPIASPDGQDVSALVRRPATLKQAIAEPSVLAGMGAGEALPYAITPEQLKELQPQIIGDSSVWSRRMEGLRNGQPVEIKAIIFEPLVSSGPFKGIVDLISVHVSDVLPETRVGVWLYPERQREARELVSKDQDQSARLASLNDTFEVPQPIRVGLTADEQNPGQQKLEFTFGSSWGTHRSGRISQVLGRPEEAIPAYLKVQNWRTMPPSPKDEPIAPELKDAAVQQLPADVKRRHLNAAEEALFWRATCQIQKGAYESAAADLEGYLRQLATRTYSGQFRNEANYLAGISLALAGNSRRGAAFLRKVDSEDSRHAVAQWLINRWAAQNEKAE
jgi:hypothetical protein